MRGEVWIVCENCDGEVEHVVGQDVGQVPRTLASTFKHGVNKELNNENYL